MVDSGHDTYGTMWLYWNYLNSINNDARIVYDFEDGWLDEIIPNEMPVEGVVVDMNAKIMCKGVTFYLGGMLQIHMNAKGEVTAEFAKGFFE